jgi:hypothetical protein
LKSCASLNQIFFRAIELRDDGLHAMSASFNCEGLTALGFVGCGLTDASVGDIRAMILPLRDDQKTLKMFAGHFQLLDLQENSFSYRLLLELGDLFSQTALRVLDLRNNQPIDKQIAINIKKAIPRLQVRINAQEYVHFVPEEVSREIE